MGKFRRTGSKAMTQDARLKQTENLTLSIYEITKILFADVYSISVNYDSEEFDPDDRKDDSETPIVKWVDVWPIIEGMSTGGRHLVQFNAWTRKENDPQRMIARQTIDKLMAAFDPQISAPSNHAVYDYSVPATPAVVPGDRIIIMSSSGRVGRPEPESLEAIEHPDNPETFHGIKVDFSFRLASDFATQP